MAIRKYTNPREFDVSRGLQEVLRRNGMQAHITMNQNGEYFLIALGHDSPVMKYKLTEKQVDNLMNWGSNYANKTAYNTFASIVRNDFHMPDNFVSARNAFGRVAMGLHGYRLGPGEYGVPNWRPFSRMSRGWGGDYLGWGPRGGGWHMRRIYDRTFMAGGTMVPVRPDGRVKPGELNAGGYGFYYKGRQQATEQDVLDDLQIEQKIKPLESAPRPKDQAKPLSEALGNHLYFNDGFQESIKSHGIVIDAEKKTLTIQSANTKVDLQYSLTDEEVQRLTALQEKGKGGVTLQQRLDIINNVIGKDFDTPVTKEMLETRNLVPLDMKPEVRQVVEADFIKQEQQMARQEQLMAMKEQQRQEDMRIANDPNAINGKDIQALLGRKGWFQPVEHGREMVVGEIRVDKTAGEHFIMSAFINGEKVTHGISEKEYQKFLDLDDEHRLKLFDKIFKEVEIKHSDGRGTGDDMYLAQDGGIRDGMAASIENARNNSVDGATLQELNQKKGFYRETAHGREVEVGKIEVNPTTEGKYKMTAVINGESISHEITQKDYDKFMAVDDYHRMKLFSKIFNEVDMKTRPGEGTNIGAAILAALVVTGEVLTEGLGRGPRPDFYMDRHMDRKPIFYKPGVVSPGEVAQAQFEGLDFHQGMEQSEGRGRGI